ncbi:MAG: BRcat domain-containing protein [Gemmataceae bacterium]
MSTGFSCPNPTCPHVFPPDAVKGSAALRCPRCGNVFQFANRPPARPVPPPPPPPRPAPAPPPSPAVFDFSSDEEPAPRRRRRPAQRGGGMVFGAVLFTVLAAAVGAAAYLAVTYWPRGDDPRKAGPAVGNFTFKTATAWKPDEKTRRLLDARVALTRANPRAHLGLAFEDHKTRTPSDDELLDDAVKRLKGVFPRLEYVDPIHAGLGKLGELDGEPAWKLEFRATGADEVPVAGECLFLARRGYGYWWMTWGPAEDADGLPAVWEKLRAGFKFHDDRDGWQPSPRPATAVTLDGVPVRLDYAHDLWRPADSPKDYDPLAEVVLRSFEVSGEKGRARQDAHAGKAATVQMLVLPPASSVKAAVATAEGAVKKQLEKLDLTVKLEPFADPSGQPAVTPEVGALKGETRQLTIKLNADASRFAVLAVAVRREGVLAVFCECPPDKRGYWLGEFKALLATVRPAE